ncbi:MAG TPA: hypothetical protein VI248_14515 [Kineosporiaceae bacterium]
MQGLAQALVELGAAVPNPGPVAPPGMERPAEMLLGWMKWIGILAGMVGLGMCALMMIIGRRNRSSLAVDGAAGIPWVLAGLSLITLSSGLVAAVLG